MGIFVTPRVDTSTTLRQVVNPKCTQRAGRCDGASVWVRVGDSRSVQRGSSRVSSCSLVPRRPDSSLSCPPDLAVTPVATFCPRGHRYHCTGARKAEGCRARTPRLGWPAHRAATRPRADPCRRRARQRAIARSPHTSPRAHPLTEVQQRFARKRPTALGGRLLGLDRVQLSLKVRVVDLTKLVQTEQSLSLSDQNSQATCCSEVRSLVSCRAASDLPENHVRAG